MTFVAIAIREYLSLWSLILLWSIVSSSTGKKKMPISQVGKTNEVSCVAPYVVSCLALAASFSEDSLPVRLDAKFLTLTVPVGTQASLTMLLPFTVSSAFRICKACAFHQIAYSLSTSAQWRLICIHVHIEPATTACMTPDISIILKPCCLSLTSLVLSICP